ncbi:MAG TPA: hypothetical protein VGQ99_11630, partial [Tepidisphaeraceae bacterium]|nr:hypothetical protein [Tepidisphaeraceae bacterium]
EVGNIEAPRVIPMITNQARATKEDGRWYRIDGFELSYLTAIRAVPLRDLMSTEIELAATNDGLVAPREPLKASRFRLADVPRLKEHRFYQSAIAAINTQIVRRIDAAGFMGVVVAPDSGDIDLEAGVDRRPPNKNVARINILQARIVQMRTIAFGRRIPPDTRVNFPAHAAILAKSPVRPYRKGDTGRAYLLRKDLLIDYLAKLNAVPGQQVHVAISTAEEPGGMVLDFLVFGDEFEMP